MIDPEKIKLKARLIEFLKTDTQAQIVYLQSIREQFVEIVTDHELALATEQMSNSAFILFVINNLIEARRRYLLDLDVFSQRKLNELKQFGPGALFEQETRYADGRQKRQLFFYPGLKKFPMMPTVLHRDGEGEYRFTDSFGLYVPKRGDCHDHYEYGSGRDEIKHGFTTQIAHKIEGRSYTFVAASDYNSSEYSGKRAGSRWKIDHRGLDMSLTVDTGVILWLV
jgi:hypothetical protein